MKKTAVLLTMLVALSFLAVQVPSEADAMLSADDIRIANLYEGATISWTTNQKTTGYVLYGLGSEANISTRANDIRGDVASFTHICRLNLGAESRNRTLYFDIFVGSNIRITITGPLNMTIPDVDDYTTMRNSIPFYGEVKNDIVPISAALVHIKVVESQAKGGRTSTNLTTISNAGIFNENLGNYIFFGTELYQPSAGDILHIEINAGPMGTLTKNIVLDSTTLAPPLDLGEFLIPLPFTISSPGASPSAGNTETNFTFSLVYTSSAAETPIIRLVLDGQEYNMTMASGTLASGATFSYITTLAEGTHTYHFRIILGDIDISTAESTGGQKTMIVEQVAPPPTEPENNMLLIAGLVVVIAASIGLALVLKKRMG